MPYQSKTLLLAGSGEFTKGMETTDSYVLSFADQKNRRIVVLPTAAGLESDWDKWVKMGITHFAKFGFVAEGIDILFKEDSNNKEKVDLLKNYSVVYFSGGDPGHLLSVVKGSYLEEVLRDLYNCGVILMGCSAGAMLFGRYVITNVYPMQKDLALQPIWDSALLLEPYTVIPHYDYVLNEDKDLFERIKNQTGDFMKKYVGIEEDTALLITDQTDGTVLGSGAIHIFDEGKETIYKSGSTFNVSLH